MDIEYAVAQSASATEISNTFSQMNGKITDHLSPAAWRWKEKIIKKWKSINLLNSRNLPKMCPTILSYDPYTDSFKS